MGLSHYPSAADGVLPILVMNTVISVAIMKNMVRWVLQVVGCAQLIQEDEENEEVSPYRLRERRVSTTLFKSLCRCPIECCVCLHRFEAEEEVSELSCKHFFHKGCLDKWLDHKHSTCPLCRSTF
ncbi:RING-type E3 ubiquitin transferase [Ranunculus cassubicifolius]